MSLRKFMHKRNKYKEEPNFKQLAILYPEFRKVAITNIAGKVQINFRDAESLRVLTQTLLKHDFDLHVEIPPTKLVPALPLRLNYILWIEDLLKHAGINDLTSVHGIDIGTGAVCIYPLLFSKIYHSQMVGTDINLESLNSARDNIKRNNLENLIRVTLVNKKTILEEILQGDEEYSFVMCNPPFFETDRGLGKKIKEKPPRNAPTGIETEMKIQGGERAFISQLIDESLKYKNKVKIYTTMFGQKSSLAFLRNLLKSKEIFNTTWTEFCQGFTKRWGIAWTFAEKDEINLTTAPVIRTRTEVMMSKKDKSMEIIFPATENLNCLNDLVTLLKTWISQLKLKMEEIELNNDDDDDDDDDDDEDDEKYASWACQLQAFSDTWSHARRKRRMEMRQEALKKQRLDDSNAVETETIDKESTVADSKDTKEESAIDKLDANEKESEVAEKNSDPLLVCTLLAREKGKIDNDSEESVSEEEKSDDQKMLRICLVYESGHGGKQSLETLRQYFVNKLNIRKFFCKQSGSKPNKKKRKKTKKKTI